jgi:hypothetical protein
MVNQCSSKAKFLFRLKVTAIYIVKLLNYFNSEYIRCAIKKKKITGNKINVNSIDFSTSVFKCYYRYIYIIIQGSEGGSKN